MTLKLNDYINDQNRKLKRETIRKHLLNILSEELSMGIAIVVPYTREELEADINQEDKKVFNQVLSEYGDTYTKSFTEFEDMELDEFMMYADIEEADIKVIYFNTNGNLGRAQAVARLLSYKNDKAIYIRDGKKVVFKGGIKYEKNTFE